MGASFDRAIPVIIEHEGERFTNYSWDPGGATKYGLTLGWCIEHHLDIDHDGDVDVLDVKNMTLEEAEGAYEEYIWNPEGYSRFSGQLIATKTFDVAVNMGARRSHRYLQRALNGCGFNLKEDGVLGPLTIGAANAANIERLLDEFCFLQESHYRAWVAAKPNERTVALKGLLRRSRWPFDDNGSLPAEEEDVA